MTRININKAVDKSFENKSLKEIADAPVSALEGLGKSIDKALAPVGITSLRGFATWSTGLLANSLVALSASDKKAEYDGRSVKDVLASSLSEFDGINPDLALALSRQNLKTVQDLATWKYLGWARAITELADLSEDEAPVEASAAVATSF